MPEPLTVAIHHRAGSFSDRWIEQCRSQNIPYRIVDAFSTDIIALCRDCQLFMWHFDHENRLEAEVANAVLTSLEFSGLTVFPDYRTRWHFDDKLAQKYLFEAAGIPHMASQIYFEREAAKVAVAKQKFPIVWKLRRGAGSANVGLLRSVADGHAFVRTMFGKGHRVASGYFTDVATRFRSVKSWKSALEKAARAPKAIQRRLTLNKASGRERGYVLLQDFAPANDSDTRVTVIGDSAWSFRRMVRPNDFRASGSRSIVYDPEAIDKRCISLAFEATDKMRAQCLALDFVFAEDGTPRLIECSYGFLPSAVAQAPGHFTRDLTWIPGPTHPQDVQLEHVLNQHRARVGHA